MAFVGGGCSAASTKVDYLKPDRLGFLPPPPDHDDQFRMSSIILKA
jgi:hypothetical protein